MAQVNFYNRIDMYQPVTASDVVTDKYTTVHNEMFNYAVNKFLDANKNYKDEVSYKFVEQIKDDAKYWEPSYLIVVKTEFPFKKKKIDLSYYWNNEFIKDKLDDKDIYDTLNEDDIYDEVIYYDYVNGKAKINNKLSDNKKWIKFNKLNEDIQINLDKVLY